MFGTWSIFSMALYTCINPGIYQAVSSPLVPVEAPVQPVHRNSLSSGNKQLWDCRLLTRENALAKLKGAPMGFFIIRSSDKAFACLSMVAPTGPYHILIESTATGYRLQRDYPTESFRYEFSVYLYVAALTVLSFLTPFPLSIYFAIL